MRLLDLDIYSWTYRGFLSRVTHPEKKTLIFTPNPEMLLAASRDPGFLQILRKADYLTPDGTGLYLAALMQDGYPALSAGWKMLTSKRWISEKYGDLIKWSDLTQDILSHACVHQKRILLIDNYRITDPQNEFEQKKMQIQSRMIEVFHERYPDLLIQVFFLGEMSPDAIAHHIELSHIDYVFGCSGMKTQEQMLFDIFSYLPSHLLVVGLWVGSSFDYLLGLQKRAPRVFQDLGLEWLYRLIMDPRRRWKRIVDAVWRFPRMIRDRDV